MHPVETETMSGGAPRTSAFGSGAGGAGGAQRLSSALGWFSLGLGLAQVVVPASVARLAGAEPTPDTLRLMRALGLREISSGAGILSGRRTEDWVRARVVGDLMDLALLARLLTDDGSARGKTVAATLAVAGVTALDALAATKLKSRSVGARTGASRSDEMDADTEQATRTIRRAITIRRSPEEVAAFWREHAAENDALAEQVRFVPAPGGRGTEVHLERTYEKPGKIAEIIGKIRHDDPAQYAFDELFALKQILETGDVVISDAWLNGPHKTHAAQPE
jgi:hypothetical protein